MTKEELLKPRYKVIADYPYSPFEVGVILINCDDGEMYSIKHGYTPTGKIIKQNEIDKYYHLFKKLEWWEDRCQKDMPEYVKLINGKICKVTRRFAYNVIEISFDEKLRDIPLKVCSPSTKEEYEAQNK